MASTGEHYNVGRNVSCKSVVDLAVRRVMSVTDEEFADMTVSTLAYALKVDRYKLLRQFKRQTNMTLSDFIFKEKMTRASFLLNLSDTITVREVAERIGFCTSDYFIKKFREYYGIVPGEYRRLKTGRFEN